MKFAKFLVVLGLTVAVAAPASAQITNIDDIQLYTDAGVPASPFNGNAVTVRGIITTLKGTYNGGTHYIQDATGGIQFFDSAAPTFAIGDEVEVTGTISSFGGEIQISGPFSYNFIGATTPVAPTVYTAAEFNDNDSSGTQNSADYEIVGILGQVTGTVVFRAGDATPPFAQGLFSLASGADTLAVFIDSTTGINTSALQAGDEYQVTGPIVNFSGLLELKPRFQNDLIENPGNPAPLISAVTPSPWSPEVNQAITISANIIDNGTVTSATLFYRAAGAPTFSSAPMSDLGSGLYSGFIPGTTASGVEYYIQATDDTAQTASLPADAPTGFLRLAVGTTSIVAIQSTLQPGTDISAFSGQRVNVEALVTVAPGELQTNGLSNYVVGEAQGGEWSGIFVFEGSGANVLFRGDRVRIAGTVDEFNGITELLPLNGQAVELVSFGNPMPPIPVLSTDVMDVSESWESVIVATRRAAVADTAFGGELWQLKDSTSDSVIFVSPAPGVNTIATLGEEMYVTGFLDTRFGRNDLVPRDDADIVLADAVSVGNTPRTDAARFDSIVPNPFNPSTKISFSVPVASKIELAIFDSRGRRVNTLVAGPMEAGEHAITWTGQDGEGSPVSSGVYYVRLRDGLKSVSVEKVTLSK